MKKNPGFEKIWLVLYALGITLLPPLQTGHKTLFFAELLLLPLIVRLFLNRPRSLMPPQKLINVWLALGIAFVAGLWRGDVAMAISNYDLKDDHFRLAQDLIRFVRWILLFSTPWLVHQAINLRNDDSMALFFTEIFKTCVLVAAALGLVDYFGFIHLAPLYGYVVPVDTGWHDRLHGTFQAPLEASLVFGAACVLIVTQFYLGRRVSKKDAATFILSFGALLATWGGTALGALLVCVLALPALKKDRRTLKYTALAAAAAALVTVISVPHWLIVQKTNNLTIRFAPWVGWAKELPTHPRFIFTGLGFTGLVVDNSFLLLVIIGGIILGVTAVRWLWSLSRTVSKPFALFYVFWFISWLTLDSIGYWGLGRTAWMLFGLFHWPKHLERS